MKAPISFRVLSSFIGSATIQISCATLGATIYYTTDGNNPSTSSTPYSAPFEVSQNATIKAIAVKTGLLDSDVASVDIKIALPTPVIVKNAGTAIDNCKINITNLADYASYSGVSYRYTIDGAEPTEASPVTTGEISIDANCTVKVKAFCPNYEASASASLAVSDLKVQTPVISDVTA